MSAVVKEKELILIWNIKHLQKTQSFDFITISSPFFECEFLIDIEWNLVLHKDTLNHLFFYIYRKGSSGLPVRIPIDYQYELTTSDGIILKTSDILSYSFSEDGMSDKNELIELNDRNMPEDVCLRCRMIIPCLKSSPRSVLSWLAETDIVDATYRFQFVLKFSNSKDWGVVEKVTVENMPIDITFKYVDDQLQICLFSKIENKTLHRVRCRMELKNEKSETVIEKNGVFIFSNTSGVWQFPSFIDKQNLKETNCFILKKIYMKIVFYYRYKSFEGDSTTEKDAALTKIKDEANSLLYLQQHLRNMLNEKTYADVKLRAAADVFFAHRSLLATRSPVFKAMFHQDMLESKTNIIDIHDVEAKTLKYFLEYLYTGVVDDIDDEMALSLLVVADKYQVSPLTEKCSTFLKSVLSYDNVLNVLLVADMVNEEQLKLFTVEYIVENSTQVLSSPNWPQWVKTNSTIASELILKISNKFDTSSKSNTV